MEPSPHASARLRPPPILPDQPAGSGAGTATTGHFARETQ